MLWCQLKRSQGLEEGVRCQFRQFHVDSIGVVEGTLKRHVNRGVSQSKFWKLTSKFQTGVPCLAMDSAGISLSFIVSPFLSERVLKALPKYHVVAPVQVDASGHFLSYGLHHPFTSSRRKRDLDGSEDRVYYRISHEEEDLFFNLTVNWGFLSKSYFVERRYGNLSHVKMVASSGPPCHLRGTVLQQGARIGTAALSSCHGLVSAWVHHLSPLPPAS